MTDNYISIEPRIPPHSCEAEQMILAFIINDNSLWDIVYSNLKKEDFYVKEHAQLFKLFYNYKTSKTLKFDLNNIINHIESNVDDKTGGKEYVLAIKGSLPKENNQELLKLCIKTVKEKSLLRQTIKKANDLLDFLYLN